LEKIVPKKESLIAGAAGFALRPHMRRGTKALAHKLDKVTPENSPLRSIWLERIAGAVFDFMGEETDSIPLEILLSDIGELFNAAWFNGTGGVDGWIEKMRLRAQDEAKSVTSAEDAQAVVERFEQRVSAVSMVAERAVELADKPTGEGQDPLSSVGELLGSLGQRIGGYLDKLGDALEQVAGLKFSEEDEVEIRELEQQLNEAKRHRRAERYKQILEDGIAKAQDGV